MASLASLLSWLSLSLLLSLCPSLCALSYRQLLMSGIEQRSINSPSAIAPLPDHSGLHLSEFLKRGDIQGLKAAAAVDPSLFLGITSYAGYYTVNESINANTFVWYFPALNGNASAPLLIWLQGGPGASSLFGLFAEIGPLQVLANMSLTPAPYTWCANYSCLFIDNPPGTGLSYVNPGGYCTNWECYGTYLDSALRQFLQSFPEIQNVPVYIIGESYGGKYSPAMTFTVWQNNMKGAQPKVNLAGFAVGDGWTDPVHQMEQYADLMYGYGLIDERQWDAVTYDYIGASIEAINHGDFLAAFDAWDKFINGDIWPFSTFYYNATGLLDYFNVIQDSEPASFGYPLTFMSQPKILAAVHAGNHTLNPGMPVEMALLSDFMVSLAPQMSMMLDAGIPALIYNGQLDIIIGAPLTEWYLHQLEWKGSEAYLNASKAVWHVDGLVGGYVRQAGPLTQAVVRGAGHMVPADQPARANNLITRWIERLPFS